jgi:hypothetical protein
MCLLTLLLGTAALHGAADAARIAQLIEQLGIPIYAEREAATKAFDQIGEAALGPLKKASQDSADAEIRRRANQLVAAIEPRVLEARALAIRRSGLSPEEKGRRLKAMVKEGMTGHEVYRLLGLPDGMAGSLHWSVAWYSGYGLTIRFDQNHKVQLVRHRRSE